ncbi:MAG: hypothetical protein IPF52_03920 [Saprospiraceae bacterium]|nr:hypothetical protein [Saprospiraceae bacterium]
MKENLRYTGDPERLYDFMDEFTVHCHKCDGKAEVSIPSHFDYKNAVLKCTSCHYSEKAIDRIRHKPTGKAKCHQCLEFLDLTVLKGYKSIPSYVNITCKYCKTINKVNENWEPYIAKYHDSGIIDLAFGLPLWYQDIVKGNIIWAFNMRHLTEIKNYVKSTLRERTTDKFKMTMVEKLPDFIKMAKNREEVLKALQGMVSK